MSSGTGQHHNMDDCTKQQPFGSNEEVDMVDCILDSPSDTATFGSMDGSTTDHPPLDICFERDLTMNDPLPAHNTSVGYFCTDEYAPQLPIQETPPRTTVYPTPRSALPPAEPRVSSPTTPTKPSKEGRKSKAKKNKNNKEKEFPCPYPGCTRVSTCPSNLDEHILTHTKTKDYPCEYRNEKGVLCNKSFSRPWSLHRHYESVHKMDVHVPKKNPVRGTAGKGSPKGSVRKTSLSDQKPLPGGPPPTILADHTSSLHDPFMPLATGIRINVNIFGFDGPYWCASCSACFYEVNDLLQHNHIQHDILSSPYCSCNSCNAEYFAPETLTTMHPTSPNIYEGRFDDMDVEPEDETMQIDPALHTPDMSDLDHGLNSLNTHPYTIHSFANSAVSPAPLVTLSPTSSVSSACFSDQDSGIHTPTQSLPDVDTEMMSSIPDADITYTTDGYPIHNYADLSSSVWYSGLDVDDSNMTADQRATFGFLGGEDGM